MEMSGRSILPGGDGRAGRHEQQAPVCYNFYIMDDRVYRKEFKVDVHAADFRGLARPNVLLDFLQDTAGEGVGCAGLSVPELWKKQLCWVISRYHIVVHRYPRFGESVSVHTWPSGCSEYFALRDFEAFDAQGGRILTGTSSWVVMNVETRKPIKMAGFIPEGYTLDKRALVDGFPSLPALPDPAGDVPGLDFRVLSADLDFNKHVNNVVFIRWALEAVPPEILLGSIPVEFEISYKAEAFFGDTVVSRALSLPAEEGRENGLTFLHGITNRSNGVELARLRTRWEKWRKE